MIENFTPPAYQNGETISAPELDNVFTAIHSVLEQIIEETPSTYAEQAAESAAAAAASAEAAASYEFTDPEVTGSITFAGTGNFIEGDFSNATEALRVKFRTTIENGNTFVGVVPNGSGSAAHSKYYSSSDTGNSSTLLVGTSDNNASIVVGKTGAGAYLPLNIYVAAVLALQFSDIDGTPKVQQGIRFGNTNVAASDVLNWHERGTFTPSVSGFSSAGVATYFNRIGRYRRFGNKVEIHIYLSWSAHTGLGDIYVDGLPFTALSATISALAVHYSGLNLGAGKQLSAAVSGNFNMVNFYACDPAGGSTIGVPMDSSVAYLSVNGTYEV
ncbi:MAG TPA: hypothetical protein VN030_11555 [Cellvibrio sp.]|nr:hypothetical protein [Cellvibrio sp.]